MAKVRTMVTIPSDNALPRDFVVNTWAFGNVDLTSDDDLDAIDDQLLDFYNDNGGSGTPIVGFMANDVKSPFIVKHYNLDSPEPRAPLRTTELIMSNITVSGSDHLPRETALCLSFQGVQVSGEPQARKRGRIYLGPFVSNGGTIAANGAPSTTLIQEIVDSASRMLTASNAATWYWAIYSPTDDVVVRVDNGWVDNAWDTQRRRGFAATSRVTFPTI